MLKMSIGDPRLTSGKVVVNLRENGQLFPMFMLFAIFGGMEYIYWQHIDEFVTNGDAFSLRWNLIIAVPAALLWVWAELNKQYGYQITGGVLFASFGPILIGPMVFRQYYFFQFWEADALFGLGFLGFIVLFVWYFYAKFCR